MRLFIAADLSDEAPRAAAKTCEILARALTKSGAAQDGDVKWVAPSAMHLTLHFLGDIEEAKAKALCEALAAPLDAPAFHVAFGGVDLFPPAGPPRVIWIGVGAGAESLERAHKELEARLRSLAFETEARPFRPHLTLGRFRRPAGNDARRILLATPTRVIPGCRIDHVTLYDPGLKKFGAFGHPV